MPYKSKAQQGFFNAKLADGSMDKDMVDEFDKATNYGKLPARVRKPRKLKAQKASSLIGPDKAKDPVGY